MSTTYASRPGRPPLRLTPRGRWSAIGAAALVILALAATLALMRSVGHACTVASGEQSVELSTEEAQLAATAVARVIREGGDQTVARREVRRAADLSAEDAVPVAMALAGRSRAALTCEHGGGSPDEPDRLGSSGLTERAEVVRRDLRSAWPGAPLGGFAPGGVRDGHMPGSAHYDGRAIDAFFRPITANQKRLGWAMAQYLVAHAERLEIETVIFDSRIWTARRASQGWRDYRVDTSGRSKQVAQVLEHRDHVHVDVAD